MLQPTRIEFFNTFDEMKSGTVKSQLLASGLKDYDGFENYIPRRITDSKRMQGRLIFAKIIHDNQEDYYVSDVAISYIKLK